MGSWENILDTVSLDDSPDKMETVNSTTGAFEPAHANANVENPPPFFDADPATFPAAIGLPAAVESRPLQGFAVHNVRTIVNGDVGIKNPVTESPPASLGVLGSTTIADISYQLTNGFNGLANDYLDDFTAELNFDPDSLPLVMTELNDLLGLETALQTAVMTIDVNSVTMADLGSALSTAGFAIDAILTDVEFDALPTDQSVDFVRASRTYSLSDIQAATPLTGVGLDALEELTGVSLSGDLDVLADLHFTIAFGVDTEGFYLLPGNGLYSHIVASGTATAGLGAFGQIEGEASLEFSPSVQLVNGNADGRIRLSDLSASFSARSVLYVEGTAELNLGFAFSGVGDGTIDFGGRWIWDLNPNGQGFELNVSSSGLNEDALLNSLANLIDMGLERISDQADDLGRMVQNVPFIGDALGTGLQSLIEAGLEYDDPNGSARDYFDADSTLQGFVVCNVRTIVNRGVDIKKLAQRGIEILAMAEPGDFIDGSYAEKDLLTLRLIHNESQSMGVEDSGIQTFGSGAASVELSLDAQVLGNAEADFDFVIGLDGRHGAFVREGSMLAVDLQLDGQLNGSARIGALGSVVVDAAGQFDASATLTLDDGDATPEERLYLLEDVPGKTLAGALDNADAITLDGLLTLDELTITGEIPGLGGVLPNVVISGTGFYNLSTGESELTIDSNAMYEGIVELAMAGLNKLGDMSDELARMVRNVPLIGKDLSVGLTSVIASPLQNIMIPDAGVEAYLNSRGITVVEIVSWSDLLAGTFDDLLILRYNPTPFTPEKPLTVEVGGSFGTDLVGVELDGQVAVMPSLDLDITFSVGANGVFLVEGNSQGDGGMLTVSMPVVGELGGTVHVGNLGQASIITDAVLDASAQLILSDFDKIPDERFYLFGGDLESEFEVADILKTDEALTFTGVLDLDAELSIANPAASIPLIGNYLPNELTWGALFNYDLLSDEFSYTPKQSSLDEIEALFRTTEDEIIGGLIDVIAQYNPLPESVRNVLSTKIPILEGDIVDLMGMLHTLDPSTPEIDSTVAKFLVNPSENQDTLQDGRDSDGVTFNIDIFEGGNILNLLMGRPTDIVSLEMHTDIDISNASLPTPDIPLLTFFGVADITVGGALTFDLGFQADVLMGFDTNGF